MCPYIYICVCTCICVHEVRDCDPADAKAAFERLEVAMSAVEALCCVFFVCIHDRILQEDVSEYMYVEHKNKKKIYIYIYVCMYKHICTKKYIYIYIYIYITYSLN